MKEGDLEEFINKFDLIVFMIIAMFALMTVLTSAIAIM